MCLSTAYLNEMNPDTAVMKNVMTVECAGGKVILTDLMERKYEIEGTLKKASLTDGYVIIQPVQ